MTMAFSTRTVMKQASLWVALAGVTLVIGQGIASAEDAESVLMKQPLSNITGKVATVLTVAYAPGAASSPHVHPGSAFVYVLEGANASQTESAKILVFLLAQEGEAIKAPIQ
jgi:quercetin dioxygenase-like cupin family protein